MTRTKIRRIGLWSSLTALAAFGLTALANNRNLGFGHSVSRRHQLGLLVAAILLCIVHSVLHLLTHRKEDNHAQRNKRT